MRKGGGGDGGNGGRWTADLMHVPFHDTFTFPFFSFLFFSLPSNFPKFSRSNMGISSVISSGLVAFWFICFSLDSIPFDQHAGKRGRVTFLNSGTNFGVFVRIATERKGSKV